VLEDLRGSRTAADYPLVLRMEFAPGLSNGCDRISEKELASRRVSTGSRVNELC
jgi:hypothetical protein